MLTTMNIYLNSTGNDLLDANLMNTINSVTLCYQNKICKLINIRVGANAKSKNKPWSNEVGE